MLAKAAALLCAALAVRLLDEDGISWRTCPATPRIATPCASNSFPGSGNNVMTFVLLLLNVGVYLSELRDMDPAIAIFALWPLGNEATGAPPFHWWQIVTYSVLHGGTAHLLFNMWGLYLFGREVERVVGGGRLLTLYVASVVSAALAQLAVLSLHGGPSYPTIGASGGVFGLLLAFAMLFPRRRLVLLFPPIPMPAWLFALLYAVAELALGLSGSVGVAHFAHLGGMLGAWIVLRSWMRGRRAG
jgi:membrane associated rhomboid family serine protease